MDPIGFDITVLGSKGGPLESSTSSFLIKPTRLSYQDILSTNDNSKIFSIDAGAGLGRIAELINDQFDGDPNRLTNALLRFYGKSLQSINSSSHVKSVGAFDLQKEKITGSPIQVANRLFNLVKPVLVTHPHLDHIAALGINSPSYGIHSGKVIYGIPSTIKGLRDHIFNDLVWPNLTTEANGKFLSLTELETEEDASFLDINDTYRVKSFMVNHGCMQIAHKNPYYSTAFLIQDKYSKQYILVFGDVESDEASSRSGCQKTPNPHANYRIWEFIADLIIDKQLNTLIIECSTPNQPEDVPLYGHLTPSALYEELSTLESVVSKKTLERGHDASKPLTGVHCFITHVKDIPVSDIDPKKIVLDELNELENTNQLGVLFTMILAGQTYTTNP